MKRLLLGPGRPLGSDPQPIPLRLARPSKDRDAVGEQRLDRLAPWLKRLRSSLGLGHAVELEESHGIVGTAIGSRRGDIETAIIEHEGLRPNRVGLGLILREARIADRQFEPLADRAVDRVERGCRVFHPRRPGMHDEPLLVLIDILHQFRSDHPLEPGHQLGDAPPVEGARQRSEEVAGHGQRK